MVLIGQQTLVPGEMPDMRNNCCILLSAVVFVLQDIRWNRSKALAKGTILK